ncbi:cytochrome P450 2K6 isoform X1 [Cricetulus griseus]|uniref:cytochrome P450 2K6 isoform X1 n=1 Tax=Cricetulus griseus TaxID=10029 RepID=UPI0015C3B968|nr:cytochrome P450 2K6 isoform X1 [Cricetulus griseus]
MAKAYKLQSPPGPKPWPVIGNLHILNLKRPYQTMLELSKKYGSIYSIHMGPRKVVVLSGYETVKDALVKYGNQFEERSRVPIFERLFNGKGKPFEIKKVLNASVANVIVSVLFGKRFDYQDPQFLRLLTLIGENVKLIGSSRIVLFNMFPVLGFLLRSHKKVLRNRDEIFSVIRMTLLEHHQNLDKNDPRSFIDAFLLRQQEENDISADYFNEENLLALVSNLFAAGTETTATTLRWGVTLMMRYPEVQEKVHDEIVKVVGSAQPRIEHRTQMPYTDAVVHEIQRFADILPTSLPHETTTDVIFKNYYIPKTETLTPRRKSKAAESWFFEHFLETQPRNISQVSRNLCV